MKNHFTRTLAGFFAIATLSLASCEKDEDRVTLTPENAPTLATSTNTVVLAQGNSKATALTFSWSPITSFSWSGTENSYDPAVTYSIELDQQGDNFASPVSLETGAGPNTVVPVGILNTALNNLGLTPGQATPIEARLRAVYAANSPVFSPVVALTATSFECKAPTTDVWSIIGLAGVDWNTDILLTYDCDLKAYTLTRNLKAEAFKFRRNRDWGVSYGSTTPRDANDTAPLDTNQDNNITVPTAGTYTIIFDPINKTYTLSPQ